MKRGVLAVLVLLAVVGCGERNDGLSGGTPPGPETTGASAVDQESLWGHEFVLTDASRGDAPMELVAEVTLRFTDDLVHANAGCSGMSGPARLDADNRLVVGELWSTAIGCDKERQVQNEWMHDFLNGSPTVELAGERLTLRGEDVRLVLTERSVADPDRPLEGTTWTVETLVDGQTASSAGPEKATVEFAGGQAKVFTGCNSGSAAYRVSGDTITLEPLTLTRKACPGEIMAVESAMVAVLEGSVTYDVTSASLTMKHPSGKGLQLRAE